MKAYILFLLLLLSTSTIFAQGIDIFDQEQENFADFMIDLDLGLAAESAIDMETEGPLEVAFEYSIDCMTLFFNNTSEGHLNSTWHFGTGDSSREEHPYFIYTEPGTYMIKLTVTNGAGLQLSTTKEVVIEGCGGSIDTPTGIEELEAAENKFILPKVYPNPATDYIKFKFEEETRGEMIIVSLLGQEMDLIVNPPQELHLELCEYPSGIYLYTFVNETGKVLDVNRFIVE